MLHDFESELGHTFGHAARHVVSIISADQRKLPERLPEHQRPIFPLTKECEKACVCICICICICIYIYRYRYRYRYRGVYTWVRAFEVQLLVGSGSCRATCISFPSIAKMPRRSCLVETCQKHGGCIHFSRNLHHVVAMNIGGLSIAALCACCRLGERFPDICRFIDGRGERGKVYVHCGAGAVSYLTSPGCAERRLSR